MNCSGFFSAKSIFKVFLFSSVFNLISFCFFFGIDESDVSCSVGKVVKFEKGRRWQSRVSINDSGEMITGWLNYPGLRDIVVGEEYRYCYLTAYRMAVLFPLPMVEIHFEPDKYEVGFLVSVVDFHNEMNIHRHVLNLFFVFFMYFMVILVFVSRDRY